MFLLLAGLPAGIIAAVGNDGSNPFWHGGAGFFETQRIYNDARFPNLVTAMDGSIVATWSRDSAYLVRRSVDAGRSWGPITTISQMGWWERGYPGPGVHGGGTTVDENSGDIIVFVEDFRPPMAPLTVFRSNDHGDTWMPSEVSIQPDRFGNRPAMHMQETGITLRYGEHAGRLLRSARVVSNSNIDRDMRVEGHANAIYSDDGGYSWQTSDPFPALGTNEAAVVELSDGRIYFNSRRSRAHDGLDPRWRHTAWSYDGGQTWTDLEVSNVLPDGPQHHDYGMMGGLVRLPVAGQDILLFSNVDVPEIRETDVEWSARTGKRERGTIWASFDGGQTWPVKRLVFGGDFGYSSMTAGREGTPSEGWIYIFYESRSDPDGRFDTGYVARFNLDWLTGGRDWADFSPKGQINLQ